MSAPQCKTGALARQTAESALQAKLQKTEGVCAALPEISCAKEKDGLTEKSLRDLQGLRLSYSLNQVAVQQRLPNH